MSPGGLENSRRDSGKMGKEGGRGDSQAHDEKPGQDDGEDSREVEEYLQDIVQVPGLDLGGPHLFRDPFRNVRVFRFRALHGPF